MEPEVFAEVDRFVNETILAEDEALQQAVAAAEAAGLPSIQVSPAQGKLLQILVRLLGAKQILEFGTLGGYSAILMARALPADGRLITLEAKPAYAEVARRSIERAGVGERVEIRVGPALEALPTLEGEGVGPFDLVFIDADKEGYVDYYEAILPMLAPDGVIGADNTLFGSGGPNDEITQAMSKFNEHVLHDDRVEAVLLPFRDGLTLIRLR